jgi:hypothetical protein
VKFREFRGSTLPLAIFLFQQKILFSASPRLRVSKSSSLPTEKLFLGVLCAFAVKKSSLLRASRRGGPPRPTTFAFFRVLRG